MKFSDIFSTLIILHVISVLSHSVGIYLLSQIRRPVNKPSIKSNQKPLLYTLSCIDILQSVLGVVSDVLKHYDCFHVANYFEFANYGVYVIYVLFMMLLTFSRSMEVYLNIKYELYFTKRKLKIVICFIISMGTIIGIILIILTKLNITIPPKFAYVSIILDIIALFVSITTNGFILCRVLFVKNKEQSTKIHLRTTSEAANQKTPKEKQNYNAYFLFSVLVLSTLCFLLTPDLIVNLMSLGLIPISLPFYYTSLIIYACGLVADALIYITLYAPAKNILLKKISLWRRSENLYRKGSIIQLKVVSEKKFNSEVVSEQKFSFEV